MINYSRVDARRDILRHVTEILATMGVPSINNQTFKVYYEDEPKSDMDNFQHVMEVTIEFDGTLQADINPDPTTRVEGYVSFVVGTRQGGNNIPPLGIIDYIHQNMRRRWLGNVRVLQPRDVGTYSLNTWVFKRVDVPFRFDSQDFNN